jgi:hypothetical protein
MLCRSAADMPRETISINISSNPCYEAGAAFLAALAYPAADQEPQRSDLWLALCRQTIIALANENFEDWAWRHQPIKPGFFIVSDDTAEKTCRDGFDLINDRLLAGHRYGAPFLMELELGRTVPVHGLKATVSNMANLAAAELGMEDGEKNVLHRKFVPSKPVLHAAVAMQTVIQDHFAGQPGINAGTLLHDIEFLGLVVERSEIIRMMIPRLKKPKIQENETIQFILS